MFFFFFFQAEDGIRDVAVTGVQTCALPIFPFHMPPLRERAEDIPLLADCFLREFTTAYGRKPKELTAEAYRVLKEYRWPGNVRELRNLIERIVILNPQVRIDARHIPLPAARRGAAERGAE